ncbi:gluconate 5-dehydrogenase [Xylanibacter ruminicola]|jgi:gluconate 5-dehydrogenase|uniref:Gluconate 5-dehydrogenase n=1 Tax=Xylanibacter ruminicola TaxID=839 RepID=A0A1H5SFM8_XYLRU|nr:MULTISPECIES: SDR family oxidoreductase [Prevotellaceae]MCR5471264.1 SDR family oxidoreductase [Prevotella sp.]SEF49483.1 gluconate 5-dehydrogenase [Xylanibacter ruminicola]SEW15318.1 gluconate 5-dehydrogenase [Prevotella sp. khp7]
MHTLDLFSLKGKTAVVTGGCGHLGKAMVAALSDAGALVYVAGTSHDKFVSVYGTDTLLRFVKINIMDSVSIREAFRYVAEEAGSIDVLINNAAQYAGIGKKSEDLTDEDWEKCIDGIAGSTYKCIREVLPYMKEGGSIVNIASMYGIVSPYLAVYEAPCESSLIPVNYCAGKASVIQMTRYFGTYLINRGIRVNSISPGPFPSPKVQENKVFADRLREKNPSHRLGDPDDLRGAVLFLASDASKYVVGQNIQVDGGWTIW